MKFVRMLSVVTVKADKQLLDEVSSPYPPQKPVVALSYSPLLSTQERSSLRMSPSKLSSG